MTTTFAQALADLNAATTPEQLFGADQPARAYRRLARVLHPDTAPPGHTAAATDAFARLARLWAQHQGRDGTRITTRRHTYTVGARIARGDLANLHLVEYDGARAVLKLARRPSDSDLLDREAHALTTLARDGDPRCRPYLPGHVETFRHEDPATGERRTATVLRHLDGFASLARVRQAYPDGLDPRDAAWMWRRLLVAIGHAHRVGLVHGAVLPDHVLIHPELHGVVLVDWCYSTPIGTHVPAMVARHRDLYPPEVTAREPADQATDIHLAAECMRRLMGDRAHPRLLAFIAGCTLPGRRRRPHDAWRLLAELDELLEQLYGPRTFRPFTLP